MVIHKLNSSIGADQQEGELLDIIAVAHPVITLHVAIVPEFLDDGGSVMSAYL